MLIQGLIQDFGRGVARLKLCELMVTPTSLTTSSFSHMTYQMAKVNSWVVHVMLNFAFANKQEIATTNYRSFNV